MSSTPWDILGIEPTRDEQEIHRAYARMLKRYRPDEDPEGFARLVAARQDALDLRAAVAAGETTTDKPEPTASFQPQGRETSQEVPPPSGDDGDSTPPPQATGTEAPGSAFTAIITRLWELLGAMDGPAPGPIWNEEKWRAALAQIHELDLAERASLREFIVQQALPLLPVMQSVTAATTDARNHRSPGQVAAVWEDEFSIAQNQSELVRLCGASAMLNYLAWLDCHRRFSITVEGENRARIRAAALSEAVARLQHLLRGDDGTGPIWDTERWSSALAAMAESSPQNCNALREFILREALPLLPTLHSIPTAASDLHQGSGPCAVVALWEDRFSIARDHPQFALITGAHVMSRYLEWATLAALACPPENRTSAEHQFRDCLDRILPPRTTAAAPAPAEAWAPARWEELFQRLRQMNFAEGARCRDQIAQRLTLWLPTRSKRWRRIRRAANAPAAVVEQLENQFSLSDSFDGPPANADGLLRYQNWLACARRQRRNAALRERILLVIAIAIAMAAGYGATFWLK
ncbi:MAG: J domain-containing protein [Alphaproteobacteria bacterium]|nr:J domain-containing protein [Alphaproteobacteria bacterium]